MSDEARGEEPVNPHVWLEGLRADVISGKTSILELIAAAPKRDYRAHIEVMRLTMLLMQNPYVLKAQIDDAIKRAEAAGAVHDPDTIVKQIARKDGERRFERLVAEHEKNAAEQPSLLTGADFDACLAQYLHLLGHVENLWAQATELFSAETYPLAAFLSILVIEEVGKLSRLAHDLYAHDQPRRAQPTMLVDRDHRRKHFIGVMSGALVNARLDRVLGKDVIRRILHEAESDVMERTRQACLYVDMRDGHAITPAQAISKERAQTLVVLAGELMVEVLGYFPWEFERMLDAVIAFERSIGLPERKIARH